MAVAVPAAIRLVCPRCQALRAFIAQDGAVSYRCAACELNYTLATRAPTGTSNAVLAAGGTSVGVASGGAAFTSGMILLYDTGVLAEVLTVSGAPTGTAIPVTAAVRGHSSGATFGQLLVSPSYSGYGVEPQPLPPPPWGF